MKNFIPYATQDIDEEDINTVVAVLRSEWLTQGPAIPAFEAACAQYVGSKHAVAVTNGTSALHLACLALKLGPQDTLWTSPNTFVASSNSGLYCGAKVDFVDIDEKTYNMSVSALQEKLQCAQAKNQLPKVLVVVHFAGQSCDMRAIKELANRYGIKIIEDASHAIGGEYLGAKIGSCLYSDISILSFHPVKIITTGEGGMLLTNCDEINNRVRLLRSHGITRDVKEMADASEGPWYYQQMDLGYNYRMTDLQAALGLSQLKRIDTFVAKRHALAARYDEALAELPVITPWQSGDSRSAYHLYVIQLKLSDISVSRASIFDMLRKAGIGVNVHYIPVHTQPYYRQLGFKAGDFPVAESYYARALSLPLFYKLRDDEQAHVISTLKQILA